MTFDLQDAPPKPVTPELESGEAVGCTDLFCINDVVVGDCLNLMANLPNESIGAIVTDPPYSSGGRQNAQKRKSFTKLEGARQDPTVWTKDEWVQGDSMGADSFCWFMREVAIESFRVCRNSAHAYVFIDWRNLNLVTQAWESSGWQWRSLIVWSKKRLGMGSFWRSTHELVPVFTKGQPDPMPHGSFYNVIECAPPSDKEHPTMKPLEVISQLVSATTGVVLDPFCGAGTTCLAAKNLNRPFIGMDIDPKWVAIAKRRLQQDVLAL
jgi:site-specific DNA-methyltransferase (adenine-specific)